MWVSELLAVHGRMVDEIAIIKTVYTEAINHDPAITLSAPATSPGPAEHRLLADLRAGHENQNLPAFVVLTASWPSKAAAQAHLRPALGQRASCRPSTRAWLCASGDPVLYLANPPGVDAADRRAMLDALSRLNQHEVRRDRRPRNAGPHRPVRDGLPDADLGAGADRHLERARSTFSTCTARTCTSRAPSPQLPAGPPAGRARRALRADLPSRLGPARRPARRPAAASARTSTRRCGALVRT